MSAVPANFLARMATSSRARADSAEAHRPAEPLAARVQRLPPPPALRLSTQGFDVIAEVKRRSPSAGTLAGSALKLAAQSRNYVRGGAAALSVLTEPEEFDGDLAHLKEVAATAVPVPAMRKDFLVDPYQLLEARAAGAGGVLLIVRMLARDELEELAAGAAELGLFVLLEVFDEADVAIASAVADLWRGRPADCLIGVNSRDLATLQVVPQRLEALVATLPAAHPRVAESGLATAADAARFAAAGYTLALVGTALMGAVDPAALARDMIACGRAAGRGAGR